MLFLKSPLRDTKADPTLLTGAMLTYTLGKRCQDPYQCLVKVLLGIYYSGKQELRLLEKTNETRILLADRRTTKYYLFLYYTVHKVRLIIVIEKISRLFIYLYSHGRAQKRGSSREVYSCHTAFPLRLVNSGRSPETIENNLRVVLTENTIERQGIRWQHCNFSDWKLAFFCLSYISHGPK